MENPYDYILKNLCQMPTLTKWLLKLKDDRDVEYYLCQINQIQDEMDDKYTWKALQNIKNNLKTWAGISEVKEPYKHIPFEIVGYKDGIAVRRISERASGKRYQRTKKPTASCKQYEFEKSFERYTPEVEREVYGENGQ